MSSGDRSLTWDAGRPVDVRSTLGPLRRGASDPSWQRDPDGARWWGRRTPDGLGTLRLQPGRDSVQADAWGPGAGWLIDRVPALLGESDDWTSLDLSAYPRLAELLRANPGLRLPSTGLIMESLVPAVLEQRVTGKQAWTSWQQLLWRFGEAAAGPRDRLRVLPSPQTLLDVTTFQWQQLGVEAARVRPIRAAATVANRLEECVAMTPDAAYDRLTLLPGIGAWTAAEALQRATGDPDRVSLGDFHLANTVVHALTGRPRGTDDEMLELLEPWRGQRQRVVRLIELAGVGAPRFGPRYSPLDIRKL